MMTMMVKALIVALIVLAASAARAQLPPKAEAAKAVFPDSTAAVALEIELTDAELEALGKVLGRRVDLRKYALLDVQKQGAREGWIFALDVLGQTLPISFTVAVALDGAVKDIAVVAYREPHGEEIREPRFRHQFVGKQLRKDPIALDKDISAISGATISSRSATYAARKALGLAEILRARSP